MIAAYQMKMYKERRAEDKWVSDVDFVDRVEAEVNKLRSRNWSDRASARIGPFNQQGL